MILASLLLSVQLQSSVVFKQEELRYIKEHFGQIAINRIDDYQRTMDKIATMPDSEKLTAINNYVNQLLPMYDIYQHKVEDYYETPKEFLSSGYGDCEDYVALKYQSLMAVGYEEDKLYFSVVEDEINLEMHMVLLYYPDGYKDNADPLVLDNLSFKVMQLSQRTDLTPKCAINQKYYITFDEFYNPRNRHNVQKQFAKLIKKLQNGQ